MSIHRLAESEVSESEMEEHAVKPEFRRASRNMVASQLAVSKILKTLPESGKNLGKNLGCVLHTRHGELEITKDFLKVLALENTARPILFQNSLHNSTMGALSIAFRISGPCVTTSSDLDESHKLVSLLLESKRCEVCLWVQCDYLSPELKSILPSERTTPFVCRAELYASDEGLRCLEA